MRDLGKLTCLCTLGINAADVADNQGSELVSSFVARQIMRLAFKVDVSQVGLDEMREYPELVPACGELFRRTNCPKSGTQVKLTCRMGSGPRVDECMLLSAQAQLSLSFEW